MKRDDIPLQYRRITDVDWDIIAECAGKTYVEVGTHHGASVCAALEGGASMIFTIDIYDWQPKVYDEKDRRVQFEKGTSQDFADQVDAWGPPEVWVDCLFIDGSHEYEYCKIDCEALIPMVKKGGTVLFHDHNPNNPLTGVVRAVDEYLAKTPHKVFPKVEGSGNMLRVEIL